MKNFLFIDRNSFLDRRIVHCARLALSLNANAAIVMQEVTNRSQEFHIESHLFDPVEDQVDIHRFVKKRIKEDRDFDDYKSIVCDTRNQFLSLVLMSFYDFGRTFQFVFNKPDLNKIGKYLYVALAFPFYFIRFGVSNLHYFDPLGFDAENKQWDAKVQEFAAEFEPDVVIANDLNSLSIASLIASEHEAKLIYDQHELFWMQPGMSKEKVRAWKKEEQKLVENPDYFVVVNEQMADFTKSNYGDDLPITVLSNATEIHPKFDIDVKYDLLREKFNLPASSRLVIFQGGINKLRYTDVAIESLTLCKNKSVHLVFLTFENQIEEFQLMAEKLKVDDRVHFMPIVPWEEVVFWLSSADLGLIPYQANCMNTEISSPNKFYEFAAAGIPFIASKDLVNLQTAATTLNLGHTTDLKLAQDYATAFDLIFDEKNGVWDGMKKAVLDNREDLLWPSQSKDLRKLYSDLV